MANTWYEKHGYDKNPFELNPLKDEKRTLFDRENEAKEVVYRILSQNMLFIEGKKGLGKSALLKHAIDRFKGKGKVIYVDSNAVHKKLNIENLLLGAKKVSPTRKKFPKNMILLLDNVNQLSMLNNERIKYYFDQNYLRSVIFTGVSYNSVEFSDSVRSRIGKRIIKINPISPSAAVEMVMERLGEKNNDLLSEELTKEIFNRSKGDLKKFLLDCYSVCDFTIKRGRKKATKDLMKKALKRDVEKVEALKEIIEEEKSVSEFAKVCEVCGEKLKKVGEYYRCKNCDTYCTVCGAFVEEDDLVCPECGAHFD
ncbi:hypothetical protein GOV08_05360 [Candidatus Woesearchaeota archaeon]|nr:hypothetical protein [Candidatus Woesearchaeota archaeon]